MTKAEKEIKIAELKKAIESQSGKIKSLVIKKEELQFDLACLLCSFRVKDKIGNGNATYIIDSMCMYDKDRVELVGRRVQMNDVPVKKSEMIWQYLSYPDKFTLIEKGK